MRTWPRNHAEIPEHSPGLEAEELVRLAASPGNPAVDVVWGLIVTADCSCR